MSINHWEAVLFDLDGCLIDTAPDMGGALNRLLNAHGKASLSAEHIRPHVSYGARALTRLGFGDSLAPEQEDKLTQGFLAHYAANIADASVLFTGLERLLDAFDHQGVPWGIVTNKPTDLTHALIERLSPKISPQTVVCGDTLAVRKPDPAPVLLAAESLGVNPQRCVYLGDAERDIQAGNGAGMTTLATIYGYVLSSDSPSSWGADAIIEQAEQIEPWLRQHRPPPSSAK